MTSEHCSSQWEAMDQARQVLEEAYGQLSAILSRTYFPKTDLELYDAAATNVRTVKLAYDDTVRFFMDCAWKHTLTS